MSQYLKGFIHPRWLAKFLPSTHTRIFPTTQISLIVLIPKCLSKMSVISYGLEKKLFCKPALMYLILPLPEKKTYVFRILTTKKHIKIIWNLMYIPGPKFWFPPGATDCTLWILFLQMGHVLQRKNRRNIGNLLQPQCRRHEEFVTVGHGISCQRRKHLSYQVPSLLLKCWSYLQKKLWRIFRRRVHYNWAKQIDSDQHFAWCNFQKYFRIQDPFKLINWNWCNSFLCCEVILLTLGNDGFVSDLGLKKKGPDRCPAHCTSVEVNPLGATHFLTRTWENWVASIFPQKNRVKEGVTKNSPK